MLMLLERSEGPIRKHQGAALSLENLRFDTLK